MFNKFAAALQHAVDALAPPPSQQEQFVHHWKAITHYFIESNDEREPIEATSIPHHLDQMLDSLHHEEAGQEAGSGSVPEGSTTGPCMEYMLRHKILETLYALGRADCPLGMKQHVLMFFTHLLSRTNQPILPHINVHRPVHRLIRLCGNEQAAPTEAEEIQFLGVICAKIKANPYLVNFFLEVPTAASPHCSGPGIACSLTDFEGLEGAQPYHPIGPNCKLGFPLVSSLLSLVQSPDSRVVIKACEGLLLCASLPEDMAASIIAEHSRFSQVLAAQLAKLYILIPRSMHPADIDSTEAKWGLDQYSDREDMHTFAGKRHLLSFLSWLDYCDQLILDAHPKVSSALSRSICKTFLEDVLQPDLLQVCEVTAAFATSIMTRCVRLVSSQVFLEHIATFIIGSSSGDKCPTTSKLQHYFIQRSNHPSDELSIVTLKLLEVLLQKPCEVLFEHLVLQRAPEKCHLQADMELTVTTDGSSAVTAIGESQVLIDSSDMPVSSPSSTSPTSSISALSEADGEAGPVAYIDGKEPTCQSTISGVSHHSQGICDQEEEREALSEQEDRTGRQGESKAVIAGDESCAVTSGDDLLSCEAEMLVPNHTHKADPIDNGSPMTAANNDITECDLHEHNDDGDGDGDDEVSGQQSFGAPGQADHAETPITAAVAEGEGHKPSVDIHHVVHTFLTFVPHEASSCEELEDSGYDTYLKDAHRQYKAVCIQCRMWKCIESHADRHVIYGADSLLDMLFDKLSKILDQSYELNLQVTSVLAKLVLFPHPVIHELLLCTSEVTPPGGRTLYSILSKVVKDLEVRMHRVPEFKQGVAHTRRQLMGLVPESDSCERSNLMEGVIVLEEFCKELAAVAFVKHHATMFQSSGAQ
ncbi:PREDICTED: protein FAM160B1-like isoform X2 [Priapulus caudatus]|uniref:Protein FAM160B1-like isoform X2 n=1 Tax=Priapulus caudatus TaxID=37621 RepID=A0ABM1EJP4_PRICU|nr:PREDICTED: protein FAM160B1-like isoform X2 [Priapulus caudatus]